MAVLIKALLKRPNSATLAVKSWHVITLRYLKEVLFCPKAVENLKIFSLR